MSESRHVPGVIRADEAYTLKEFRMRTGLGVHSWRIVRGHLRLVKIGRKTYVRGADWIAYLNRIVSSDEETIAESEAMLT